MYTFDRKTSFSIEGSRWRRNNPDGSYPAIDNQLGFSGTADGTDLIATDVISYRINGQGDFTDAIVDLTGAVDTAAITVAEAVTALNLVLTGVLTASADVATGRLKIIEDADTATYLELKGIIAVALEFGGLVNGGGGFGTHFVDCFNNAGAIGLPKEIKDFEEIEVESGDGGTISMTIAALLKGLNPSLALTDELFELKQLIMGGSVDETVDGVTGRYTPPNTSNVYLPGFSGEVFEAKYDKGSNLRNNMVGYKRLNLNNCNGMEGDLSDDVKAWATYQYNLRVREQTISGVKVSGYTEDFLTLTQFDALGITVGQ